MDIEFHYYMTYLIAARAGFPPDQAEIIAHAAQSVDDNHILYIISGDPAGDYQNYISQTMNILKPAKQLFRIYPIFHFIPGIPSAPSARRKDGRNDPWVTTPDSPVAQKMIDSALASGDLYRIGVSAHGYVDTWAHQNFIGRRDRFNDMPDALISNVLMNVGHGAAGHQPDEPALVWTDARLVNDRVENRVRFLDAAEALFRRFAKHINPNCAEKDLAAGSEVLRIDLNSDIGAADPDNTMKDQRIQRYRNRATLSPYGDHKLDVYDEYAWFNAAVAENGAELRQNLDSFLDIADDYIDQDQEVPCNWRNPDNYKMTDWYRFVEAVKAHQNACWDILVAEKLPALGIAT